MKSAPIVILGNKIDKPNALGENELKNYLKITNLCTGKDHASRANLIDRPMEVFMCSIIKKQGYGDAFRWLSQYLN